VSGVENNRAANSAAGKELRTLSKGITMNGERVAKGQRVMLSKEQIVRLLRSNSIVTEE